MSCYRIICYNDNDNMCPACKRQKKVKNISIPVQRFNFPFLNHNQLENVHLSTNGQCKAPHETK